MWTTNSTPELRITPASDHGTLCIWSQNLLDSMECPDYLLAIPRVQPVLWRLLHGDDEDIALFLQGEVAKLG